MSKSRRPRSWFSPAIRVMNRLTFPRKFALISFFFALPLALVLVFLNARIQEQIRVAQLEIDGVDYLAPLNALHDELPEVRSFASAYLQKQPAAIEHYPTAQTETDSLMDALGEVDARLGSRGQISIRSRIGQGSTFRFFFPEIKLAAASAPSRVDAATGQAHDLADLEPCKVLVADDVVMNRDLIRAFFFGTDHQLIEASNGREAIDLARSERPDVILMDVRMPVMDGVQATRALKADDALQHIPIIVITASAMQSEEAALKPICDGYLRKPISRGDLAGQMRNFCRVKPGHRGAPPIRPTSEPASPARLTELQPHLDGCRETWEALLHAPLVGEVERFGRHLETLGEEYYHPPLRDYGRRLAASAARFDLAEMETTLQGYGALFVDPKISASTSP